MEPTQPSPNTVSTASNIDGTASSTAALVKEDNVSSTGDGQNTNVPTGEPTTPLTESTESRGTGATGDVPQTEGPAVFNVSSEASDGGMTNNGSIISTESDGGVATMEGTTSATTTEEGPLSPEDEELEDEKNTNEQAMAALQSEWSVPVQLKHFDSDSPPPPHTHTCSLTGYIDNFDKMDVNFDNKLSPNEMINTDSKIFTLLDSNEDGFVTKNELQHMMNVLQEKHDSLVENNAEFYWTKETILMINPMIQNLM